MVQGLVTLFARITNLGWFDSKGTGEYPISMKGTINNVNLSKTNKKENILHASLFLEDCTYQIVALIKSPW